MWEIMQYQICVDSYNAKVLQLDWKNEVPKFEHSLIYYTIHEKIVNFVYKCAQCWVYSMKYLFLS